jgi:endonuclease YncB( thermonuclease family)
MVIFDKGEADWNNSVNAVLVAEGLARMQPYLEEEEEELPEEINEWYNYEEEARENQTKIWLYGGAGDSDSN